MFSTLMALVFLASLIALILGLITPNLVIRWGTARSRRMVAMVFGPIAVASLVLAGATAPPSKVAPQREVAATAQKAEEAKPAETVRAQEAPGTTQETEAKPEATTQQPAPAVERIVINRDAVENKPASSQPKEDQATAILEQAAKKELGRRFKSLIAYDLFDAPGTKNVEIHFRASTESRKTMLDDSADVFERLFSTGVPIREAVAFIYWDVIDRYGNQSEQVVMKVYLTGETAQKINWKNINRYAFDQVADDVWEISALR